VSEDFCVDCDTVIDSHVEKYELTGWNYGEYGTGEYVCYKCAAGRVDADLEYVNS
jgi:hypothetical protein